MGVLTENDVASQDLHLHERINEDGICWNSTSSWLKEEDYLPSAACSDRRARGNITIP
jgi:hypothetical protein